MRRAGRHRQACMLLYFTHTVLQWGSLILLVALGDQWEANQMWDNPCICWCYLAQASSWTRHLYFIELAVGKKKKKKQPNFEMHVQHGKAEKSDINNSTVIRLDLIKKGSGIASYSPPFPLRFPGNDKDLIQLAQHCFTRLQRGIDSNWAEDN